MGRYREITSRAVAKLPDSLRSRFAGRFLVYAMVGAVAVFTVFVGSLGVLAADMVDGTPIAAASVSALWGALGAATATVAALILMPFIRDGLGLAEDIRLLEAASPAHPLMKELINRAPGTYSH